MNTIFIEVKDVIKELETAFKIKSELKEQEHKIIWARRIINETRDFISKYPEEYTTDEIKSLDKAESDIAKIDELVRRSNAFIRRYNLDAKLTMEVTL